MISHSYFKGGDFLKRSRANPSKDKAIFSRTASKTKSVNLPSKIYRGGIRF